jgi:hypothetical protein
MRKERKGDDNSKSISQRQGMKMFQLPFLKEAFNININVEKSFSQLPRASDKTFNRFQFWS